MTQKFKQSIYVAIFVSLAAQIRVSYVTDGFIVALSVLVMAIFIYCYEELSPMYIAFCSGIFSPIFRILLQTVNGDELGYIVPLVIPDSVFFFAYGIIYTCVYKYIVKGPKNLKNFPGVILFCDVMSNVCELLVREWISGTEIVTLNILVLLFFIGFVRTVLTQVILLAVDTYSNLLIKKEHDREYRKLIVQASIFESELHVMEKNVAEIEEIMRQAFALYKSMEEIDAPKELKNSSLDISKNAHEIKGDYRSIINVLKDTYIEGFDEAKMRMKDICSIEKQNLLSTIKSRGYKAELSVKVKSDFYVKQYFKMMSIIRNLVLNAAEAIGEGGGKISLTVKASGDMYQIQVRDNGPGIMMEQPEDVFIDGYSTKFNMKTGNVQRGLGLSLTKDYVENYFDGTIDVSSEKGKFTEFTIRMPKSRFEEVEDEILYH